jgi:Plant specific mitochondrial import receptor subunit TOM20
VNLLLILRVVRGVQALTRWGGALLELAHFRQGVEAYEMIDEVHHAATISKSRQTLYFS